MRAIVNAVPPNPVIRASLISCLTYPAMKASAYIWSVRFLKLQLCDILQILSEELLPETLRTSAPQSPANISTIVTEDIRNYERSDPRQCRALSRVVGLPCSHRTVYVEY
jgi:hypothetical protein